MSCTGCSLGTSTNPGGNYIGVRVADAMDGRTTLVFTGEIAVKPGERIIVEAETGPEFAEVTTTTPVLAKACSSKKAKRFLRLASDSEYADYIERTELQDAARLFADAAVAELKLDLHVVKCAVGFDRRRMTVLYTSEKKPETRELARRLGDRFEIRVEMKTIGVRDETKLIGGDIGPELTKVGSKVNADWPANWLRDPQADLQHSKMPRYQWSDEDLYKVMQYITSKLTDSDLLSDVPQLGAPAPEQMPERRPRPRMPPFRATLIWLLGRYLTPGESASPLTSCARAPGRSG